MLYRRIILFLLLVMCFSQNIFAQESDESVTKSSSSTAELEKEVSKISLSVAYTISSDFSEQENPRTISHSWLLRGAYKLPNRFSIWAAGNIFYDTQSSDVLRPDENSSPFSTNLTAGLSKKIPLGNFLYGEHKVSSSISNTFPISEKTQYEKWHAIPGAKIGLASDFFESRLSIENSLLYTYIIQEYMYSPVTGKLNSKDSLAYSISSSIKIIGGLSALLGFGVNFSRKLDNSVEYNYSNSEGLEYVLGNFSATLIYENGGFTRDGNVKLWYVDQYRRIFSGTVSYSF